MGFASISIDLYLPAMPAMGRSLGASAGTVEWTVSGYLIGFALGQLLWGPIGDRYGRRLPVAIGLVLFVTGSAGCALAGGAWVMIGWRVVQAVRACASVVLARAMVRDLYQGDRAAQMLSTLMTVMAIAPLRHTEGSSNSWHLGAGYGAGNQWPLGAAGVDHAAASGWSWRPLRKGRLINWRMALNEFSDKAI